MTVTGGRHFTACFSPEMNGANRVERLIAGTRQVGDEMIRYVTAEHGRPVEYIYNSTDSGRMKKHVSRPLR